MIWRVLTAGGGAVTSIAFFLPWLRSMVTAMSGPVNPVFSLMADVPFSGFQLARSAGNLVGLGLWLVPLVGVAAVACALLHERRGLHIALACATILVVLVSGGVLAALVNELSQTGTGIQVGLSRPVSWQPGVWIAGAGLVVTALGGVGALVAALRSRPNTALEPAA
jgi:hypothetical protein